MAPHSSTLAWQIPWTEEPGGLKSMGSLGVGHAFMVYTSQALDCSAGNCLRWALGSIHFPGLSCSGSGSWVLHKGADSVGPALCALPRSEQLR